MAWQQQVLGMTLNSSCLHMRELAASHEGSLRAARTKPLETQDSSKELCRATTLFCVHLTPRTGCHCHGTQVTRSSVRLANAATGELAAQWAPPGGSSINVASASPTQVRGCMGGVHALGAWVGCMDGVHEWGAMQRLQAAGCTCVYDWA